MVEGLEILFHSADGYHGYLEDGGQIHLIATKTTPITISHTTDIQHQNDTLLTRVILMLNSD